MSEPVLADVILPSTTGLIEDQVVNTFAFLTPVTGAVSATDADHIQFALADFYNSVDATSGETVANFLGTQLDRATNGVKIKIYDLAGHLDGTAHGSPVFERFFTLGPSQGGETNLPAEVAMVLSFHSDLTNLQQEQGSTRPAARARGRIYLGPLCTLAKVEYASSHQVYLSGGARNTVIGAATRLMNDANTVWAQWSRKNAEVLPVVGGFMDDALDSQRRRGVAATIRSTFGV
jgi:hypothetical protein